MSATRINKFFTQQGYCSRRAADRLIEEGRVGINGRLAVLGDQVTDQDVVTVDSHIVQRRDETVYLAYHKPVGITCTTEPDVKDNIIEAVEYPERIFPIGRLDKDSSGLILLTNNGDIVNPVLRVEFGHEREYLVTVDRPYPRNFLTQLERGVVVLGKKTTPCRAVQMDRSTFRLILTEGRNRQIRRMCSALEFRVVKLVRTRIMHIMLDGLAIGEWRHLSAKERETLLAALNERVAGQGAAAAQQRRSA